MKQIKGLKGTYQKNAGMLHERGIAQAKNWHGGSAHLTPHFSGLRLKEIGV